MWSGDGARGTSAPMRPMRFLAADDAALLNSLLKRPECAATHTQSWTPLLDSDRTFPQSFWKELEDRSRIALMGSFSDAFWITSAKLSPAFTVAEFDFFLTNQGKGSCQEHRHSLLSLCRILLNEGVSQVQVPCSDSLPKALRRTLASIGFVQENGFFFCRDLASCSEFLAPTFRTQRLLIRPLTVTDAPGIFRYARNPKVASAAMWNPHQSVADSLRFIQKFAIPSYRYGNLDPLGIVLCSPEENEVVGTVGAFWTRRRPETMELGFSLAEEFWGQGITTEAATPVINYVFSTLAIEQLECRCTPQNRASRRIMEKLGFRHETLIPAGFHFNGVAHDVHFVTLKRTDFMQISGAWHAPLHVSRQPL